MENDLSVFNMISDWRLRYLVHRSFHIQGRIWSRHLPTQKRYRSYLPCRFQCTLIRVEPSRATRSAALLSKLGRLSFVGPRCVLISSKQLIWANLSTTVPVWVQLVLLAALCLHEHWNINQHILAPQSPTRQLWLLISPFASFEPTKSMEHCWLPISFLFPA